MFDDKIQNQPVTVLGKTFNSEEERRSYFREELRKQLPELKKMEGFPLGEDDDIIKLSDPPFYTACPNPWLNDFIAEWEEEKKKLEKQGKRKTDFEVVEPYAADISEGKNNNIYRAHSYVTKVPHPAIMKFILHYTQPGDIIYDGFAGTGMTAIAGNFCDNPKQVDKINLEKSPDLGNIIWGPRKTIVSDLSTLASYISGNFNLKVDNYLSLLNSVEEKYKKIEDQFNWLYKTKHSNGQDGSINYVIWSDIFKCYNCSEDICYYDTAVNLEELKLNDSIICPSCLYSQNKRELEKSWKTYFNDNFNDSYKLLETKPVLIKYKFGKQTFTKTPDENDINLLNKIENYKINTWLPLSEIPDGYNLNQPKRSHGFKYVTDFFTKRNLIVLSSLFEILDQRERLIFTSLLYRSSRLVATKLDNYFAELKGKPKGGWAGTPREGTLYVPSVSTEVSVLESISTRISSIMKLYSETKDFKNGNNLISQHSATKTIIKNESVDYIFTDPPFGANRMYSDLNFIAESWLKNLTNNTKEAIENKFQNKSLFDYSNLMQQSFEEYFRVLKPGKWMTVEFSNTSAAVWNGIQNSIQSAGFIICNISALDKKQGSVKAVTTPTAVKQDLIISCYKPSSKFDEKFKQNKNLGVSVWDFVEEHLYHLAVHLTIGNATTAIVERSPKILFDRLIAFYVQRGLPVPIDAGKFQIGLKERFIERDGMYFTNEQVQEYDKKKAEHPEFIQLSLLVSSEQDGVLWLKSVLSTKRLAYQDIQPQWMQALAGVRKGDVLPELAVILEENFLKDESGKWYAPDPENEADLEKLRNKRLLKLFDTYKEEASKPKGKLKEVRVEALRTGFKQCYQDKEFKTIVTIGDRIPNNLLMEDEVLLQFYDIAISRV